MQTSNPIRILIATDNHLGYAEKDPIRGDDSFRTFQEILKHAKDEQVDCVLLAGDLFHENKPSRNTLYQTLRLLRSYCMGDGPISFQIISDQSINFPNFGTVNYEDPNFNIELPIFSIHGNHDDPTREFSHSKATDISSFRSLAALDILSASNLLNYFGKADRVDKIEIIPILIQKDQTKIAIYGLGNIRDERLYRMFEQGNVEFHRPAENEETFFNIFLVHQNRENKGRGSKNCLLESMIPEFMNLIIWGHEHECIMELRENLVKNFYILQPGSSVATSLVDGEAKEKRIAIVEVMECKFRLYTKKLETVRPFEIGEIVLSDIEKLDKNDPDIAAKMESVLVSRVQELIDNAQTSSDVLSLVRLRVEHSGFPVLHNQRFGARFVGKVANPNDILLFHRNRIKGNPNVTKAEEAWRAHAPIPPSRLDPVTIESLLQRQLHLQARKLRFLPEESMTKALEEFVVKKIPSAIEDAVDLCLEKTQERIFKDKNMRNRDEIVEMAERQKARADAEVLAKGWEEDEEEQEPRYLSFARAKVPFPPSNVEETLSRENEIADTTMHLSARENWGQQRKGSSEAVPQRNVSQTHSDSDNLSSDSPFQLSEEEADEQEESIQYTKTRPKRAARTSRKAPSRTVSTRSKKAKPQENSQSLLGFGFGFGLGSGAPSDSRKHTANKRAKSKFTQESQSQSQSQIEQDSDNNISLNSQPKLRKLPLSLRQISHSQSQQSTPSNANSQSISKRNWGRTRR